MVLPVTVSASPCSRPASSSALITTGHAADLVDVGHHVLAERLDVGQVRHLCADPVEVVEGQRRRSASCAIASRCSTAFVEPPNAITTAIAFSNASGSGSVAGRDALLEQRDDGLAGAPRVAVAAAVDGGRRGRCRAATCPSASAALAIVFAVYMPPQAPSPGQMARSIASTSSRLIRPRAQAPTASNASMIVTSARCRRSCAGQDRTGVEEHGGEVEPRGGHQHAGQRLVAAGQQHRAVEALGLHDRLDRVGDDLAADTSE